jgi:hypothetical protein
LWAVFAFMIWNVAFDRQMSTSAFHFTREQVERRQRGEPVESIEVGFRPRVTEAAAWASLWAVGALGLGVAVNLVARQSVTRSDGA